ncbi:hypothetical protein [Leucothrix pacifica]|uniref:Uncharacterized protein n=1 Tax=Leucothrix pacifica TaxID=1247513 RepID=A0A317C071_9GAMM|nr:hypothetical protein [Leucothrix pacifica]PWQ92056.1 hypothetical protein DKW60_23125 [Leucothrix pacifica]
MKYKLALSLLISSVIHTAATNFAFAEQQDWLEQGWSEKDRHEWYRGTQGSRLIPYSWFRARAMVKSSV